MFPLLTLLGVLLLAAGALVVGADSGGQSRRMPTQVPPRAVARYPLIAGGVLVVIGLAGWLLA